MLFELILVLRLVRAHPTSQNALRRPHLDRERYREESWSFVPMMTDQNECYRYRTELFLYPLQDGLGLVHYFFLHALVDSLQVVES